MEHAAQVDRPEQVGLGGAATEWDGLAGCVELADLEDGGPKCGEDPKSIG